MGAFLSCANGAISLVIRPEQQCLTACVLELIFEPALANRLRSDEAANREFLSDEHTFEGPDAVSEDENAMRINEAGLGQELQSCERTPYSQLQVGLRAITRRSLALTFAIFFHSHGDKTPAGKTVEEMGVRIVGFQVIK